MIDEPIPDPEPQQSTQQGNSEHPQRDEYKGRITRKRAAMQNSLDDNEPPTYN